MKVFTGFRTAGVAVCISVSALEACFWLRNLPWRNLGEDPLQMFDLDQSSYEKKKQLYHDSLEKNAGSFRYKTDQEIAHKSVLLLRTKAVKNHNASTPTSPPQFCNVSFDFISATWTATSSYQDLWGVCEQHGQVLSLEQGADFSVAMMMIHQVPKTGSTSLRHALGTRNAALCGPSARRPIVGCDAMKELLRDCPDLQIVMHNTMSIPPLYPAPCYHYTGSSDSSGFSNSQQGFNGALHAIAFRNFNDWAVSATRQIVARTVDQNTLSVAEQCENLSELFHSNLTSTSGTTSTCQSGFRELHFDRYSKSILRVVLKETKGNLEQNNVILLYDFHDTNYLLETLAAKWLGGSTNLSVTGSIDNNNGGNSSGTVFVDMSKRMKNHRSEQTETCPDRVLQDFHDCFDERLVRGGPY